MHTHIRTYMYIHTVIHIYICIDILSSISYVVLYSTVGHSFW